MKDIGKFFTPSVKRRLVIISILSILVLLPVQTIVISKLKQEDFHKEGTRTILDEKIYLLANFYITDDYYLFIHPTESHLEFFMRVRAEISRRDTMMRKKKLKEFIIKNGEQLPKGILFALNLAISTAK